MPGHALFVTLESAIISCGIAEIPLPEALAIEAAKSVEPLHLATDRLERAFLTDVPEEHLGQPDLPVEIVLRRSCGCKHRTPLVIG
jgi:hypothetical protein